MPAHREPADPVFTEHLRTLAAGREADAAEVARVLDAIGRLLRRQMRWRGIWNLPPERLGVIGYRNWSEPGALEELRVDAYQEAILGRFRGLRAQLAVKPQVEGLVATNVKWFLRDLQRRGDPLGYRAWEVVYNAVERAIEGGTFLVVAGGPALDLSTLLATTPQAAVRLAVDAAAEDEADDEWDEAADEPAGETAESRSAVLAERAASWNDALLPELVTAGGRGLEAVIERLAALFPELAAAGVESFRLRELVSAVREDLRPRWLARLGEADEPVAPGEVRRAGPDEPPISVVGLGPRPVDPERVVAGREAAARLLRCIEDGVEALAAGGASESEAPAVWRAERSAALEGEDAPSDRALARLLDIPRQRVAGLRKAVERVKQDCRRRLGLAGDGEEGR